MCTPFQISRIFFMSLCVMYENDENLFQTFNIAKTLYSFREQLHF